MFYALFILKMKLKDNHHIALYYNFFKTILRNTCELRNTFHTPKSYFLNTCPTSHAMLWDIFSLNGIHIQTGVGNTQTQSNKLFWGAKK